MPARPVGMSVDEERQLSQEPGPQSAIATEVVRDPADFRRLAAEWDELYLAAPRATPFQTHAWLDAWWQAYGEAGRLRVFLVRSAGRLVAAAALRLVHRGPVRVLEPLGGEISDFLDVLVSEREGRDQSVFLDALAEALHAEPGWDVLDLAEVRPTAAVEGLADRWRGPVRRLPASTCMELPVTEFDQLLLTLPTKRAREVRRVLRRSDELDLVVADVPAAEVEQAVTKLLALHAQQWQDRGGNPEHQRPRFAAHLSHALTRLVEQGRAAVVSYRLEGRELAGQVVLIGHDLVGGYLLGVAPELYDRMDFSTYVVRSDVQRALAGGCSTYSMLRGQEAYKERWQTQPVRNQRLLLARRAAPRGAGYLAAVLLRTRLVDVARERAPWLRDVRRRLRSAAGDRGRSVSGTG